MKTILVLLLLTVVAVSVNAQFDDDADDEFFERNFDDYKNAKKHPEELRQCVKCVGVQRRLGKNVQAATRYCNQHGCPLHGRRELVMNYLRELAELEENERK